MLVTVRIGMTIGGDALARPSAPADVVEDARRAEDEGFATAWTVHMSRAYDALTTLAVAGVQTARIELGVGVVPTYPRHPLALAQQAVTAQTFCGGRPSITGRCDTPTPSVSLPPQNVCAVTACWASASGCRG